MACLKNGKDSKEAGGETARKVGRNEVREGREGVKDQVRHIFCISHRFDFLLGR